MTVQANTHTATETESFYVHMYMLYSYSFHIPALHLTKLTGSRCCLVSVSLGLLLCRSLVLFPSDHLAKQLEATFPTHTHTNTHRDTNTEANWLQFIGFHSAGLKTLSTVASAASFIFGCVCFCNYLLNILTSLRCRASAHGFNEKHSENPNCFCSGQV